MEDRATPNNYKYVSDLVWLPTYLCVAVIVLGASGGGAMGTLYVLLALVGCRALLELIYRFTFGPERLHGAVGLIAFVSQLIVWAAIWVSIR